MGGIFSTPKTTHPPALQEEEVLPVPSDEVEPVRKRRKHRGHSETILTGELAPSTRKDTLLGGK